MAESWHAGGMAPADVMAEIERLRGMIRSLASERDDLREALRRHMQPLAGSDGTELCGGCLEPSKCPDAVLLEDGEAAT